jgi:alpha-galactosidase
VVQDQRATGIFFDESTGTYLLGMATSAYGLSVGGGVPGLRHLHWGAPTTIEELASSLGPADAVRGSGTLSWGAEEPVEYLPLASGRRYDEPSLRVEFADGTRMVEWHVAGHRVEREGAMSTLVVELHDDYYPLAAELCYRIFEGEDVIERWVRLRHTGSEGTVIVHQSMSADWWLPDATSYVLRYLHGGWGRETQIAETTLAPGKLVLESRRGTTSHQLNPWFALGVEGEVAEELGPVWSGAIAWSGNWKLVVETTPSGRHHVTGGWNDYDSPLHLLPGQELVTPTFAGCYSADGYGGASRAWHAYQRHWILARSARPGGSPSFPAQPVKSDGLDVRPVLYNSWEATWFGVNEADQLRLAERAAGIGAELFVLDDGWFKGRHDDHAALGDWSVDPGKFPHGLGPLVDGVKKLGMGFGLWLEPEMVNPDSDLYRAHPDWVYHYPHRTRTVGRNQMVLNLARPDVAEWVYETVHRVLSDNDIEFVKWDMNRHFSEPGWPAMAGNNPERVWVDHTRNLYGILDRLRLAHPGVAWESCSGGGGRMDLGILSRVEQFWTSDNTDAWDRVAIHEGHSQLFAPISRMAWVTDDPNPLTERRLPLSYRFHVAMSGSLGIGGNLAEWSAAELDEARRHVETYKSIRHVVQLGRLYRLATVRAGALGAAEYITDDGAEVVVLAWWGARSFQPYPSRVALVGLDASARYRDVDTGQTRHGADLMRAGIALPGPLDYGSVLAHLVKDSS